MKVLLLAFLFLIADAYGSKRYIEKCELIRIMKQLGMDGFNGLPLGMWVCLAKHLTRMDTQYQIIEAGRPYYGIFRISALKWCDNGKIPSENICGISCDKFLDDDIRDDVECLKTMVRSGWTTKSWWGYDRVCKRRTVYQYTQGCSNLNV